MTEIRNNLNISTSGGLLGGISQTAPVERGGQTTEASFPFGDSVEISNEAQNLAANLSEEDLEALAPSLSILSQGETNSSILGTIGSNGEEGANSNGLISLVRNSVFSDADLEAVGTNLNALLGGEEDSTSLIDRLEEAIEARNSAEGDDVAAAENDDSEAESSQGTASSDESDDEAGAVAADTEAADDEDVAAAGTGTAGGETAVEADQSINELV